MIINFQFLQHRGLEPEVLLLFFYFEQLGQIIKIYFKTFRKNNYFPFLLVFYRKFPIQKCFWI